MRILMLSKALVVGAYQRKLEEMAAVPGVELTVVVPPYWQEGGQRTPLQRAHTRGYELVELPMSLNGHFHLHYYPRLGDIVRRVRPDVFHIDEEPYNLATFQAMRLGRAAGALCIFFTWQNLYHAQRWNLVERYNLTRAAGAIAGNAEAEAILRRKGFRQPVTVIPQFGVDPELYRPMPDVRARRQELLPRATRDTFVIGYVGRLVEQKGLRVLLSYGELSRLSGDWRLVLIGGGELQAELTAHAAAMDIADQVDFIPSVPSTDVPRWLNVLDCLVLPSLTRPNWKEQFGRVLVEAMACQVPVVGSDSGEIPNVIGAAGIITPEGYPEELGDALVRLQSDAGLRKRLGELGRARVLAHYTQASVAQATIRFYEDILRGPTAA
jgi:glycosyltransferase involved in cell wall biosynthesis